MNPLYFFVFFLSAAICAWSVFYLLRTLRRQRLLTSLVGLFCLAMGLLLLALDLILITFTHGARYIPDYLLFNRLVSDSGFAGRWVMTVYVFIGVGIGLSIYLLARNTITKFNKNRTDA